MKGRIKRNDKEIALAAVRLEKDESDQESDWSGDFICDESVELGEYELVCEDGARGSIVVDHPIAGRRFYHFVGRGPLDKNA